MDHTDHISRSVIEHVQTFYWHSIVRKTGFVSKLCSEAHWCACLFRITKLHIQQALIQSGHAYRCFCSPDTLTEIKEKLARSGSSSSYDRRCLHLTEEEVARKVRAGEKYTVRFNVRKLDDFYSFYGAHTLVCRILPVHQDVLQLTLSFVTWGTRMHLLLRIPSS